MFLEKLVKMFCEQLTDLNKFKHPEGYFVSHEVIDCLGYCNSFPTTDASTGESHNFVN
jgi:hypothetical protein